MAKKISDLIVKTTLNSADSFPVTDSVLGSDRRIPAGSLAEAIGAATTVYVDDKASLLQDQVDAFSGGEGKTYTSLTGAMAVDPLPENKTPFRVNGDTVDDGNYIYDSSEVDGYKFLSKLANNSDIQSILNLIGTEGEPFEVA